MQHIPNSRLACRSAFFLVANIDRESPLLGGAGPLLNYLKNVEVWTFVSWGTYKVQVVDDT